MTYDEFKDLLWRSSIAFVKENNTMLGKFTYRDLVDDLHMAARRRHIIGDLQLFRTTSADGYTEALFMFSPDKLNDEEDMVFSGVGDTVWKLVLPNPDDAKPCQAKSPSHQAIDDEITEKLAASKLEVVHFKLNPNHC
jgi:hypothetical protein